MTSVRPTFTYLYLQPIHASLSTLGPEEISSLLHQIQLLRSNVPTCHNKKAQLKIRDMMKINKQYKVYGNQLHFYNTVFETSIQNTAAGTLKEQTLTLQLKSQNKASNYKTRKYIAYVSQLLSQSQEKENLADEITLECQDNESKLVCNLVVSDSRQTLASLQRMFEHQSEYQKCKNSELFFTDLLDTNTSSFLGTASTEKFQRTTRTSKDSQGGKFARRTKKRLTPVQPRKFSDPPLLPKESEGSEASSNSLNTSFYDESPKIKRITRLRRSILQPSKVQSQVDQEDFLNTLSHYKKSVTNGLLNLILVLGVFVIYAMMLPTKKL